MQKALATKQQYSDFRDKMFQDGLSQATTILCSTYRIQLLREEATDFFEKDSDLYFKPLRAVLKRQGAPGFLQLTSESTDLTDWGTSKRLDKLALSIPRSDPYKARSLPLADFTWVLEEVPTDDFDLEPKIKERLEQTAWRFDPRTACDPSYREPVPGSRIARKESRQNMATIIASAIRILRDYPAKLDTVEREWSRANDLGLLLSELKKNLALRGIDPTVRNDVRGYEGELARALEDLSRTRTEVRLTPQASQEEITEILDLFR